ncbi:MAG: hypothetical protein ACFB20_01100 [Opitutales bacterium]
MRQLGRNVLLALILVVALGLLGQLLTRHSPLHGQSGSSAVESSQTAQATAETESRETVTIRRRVAVPVGGEQTEPGTFGAGLPLRSSASIGKLPTEWANFELRFYLKSEMVPPSLPRDVDGVFYIDARLARQDANGFVLREIVFPEQFSENLLWLPAENVLFVARR